MARFFTIPSAKAFSSLLTYNSTFRERTQSSLLDLIYLNLRLWFLSLEIIKHVCTTICRPVDIIDDLCLSICLITSNLSRATLPTCSSNLLLLASYADLLKAEDANEYSIPTSSIPTIPIKYSSTSTTKCKCSRHIYCRANPTSKRYETSEVGSSI